MNPNPSIDTGLWMAVLNGVAATVCATAGYLTRVSAHDLTSLWNPWPWCATLMLLMALNALMQLDTAFVLWARDFAKAGDWYAIRRPLQIATLLVLVGGIAMVGRQVQQASAANAIAVVGIALLLTLAALRFVNLHYTDQLLDWRPVGLRLARLVELVGLGLVMLGGMQHILHKD